MEFTKEQQEKLAQAKEILQALGLPPQQYNDRSAWVFLALANLSPNQNWHNVTAPLLPTYKIMEFIRKYYGKDYKPNSRETIRRQTLHQFEQAQIIERNRDDPSRPTNSKDNNYSLNPPILEILQEYPDGDWIQRVNDFKLAVPELKALYERRLNKLQIPITLLNGDVIKLSPGKHNQLQADIIHDFCSRFIGENGRLLYIGDTASSRQEGGKFMYLEDEYLQCLDVPPLAHDKLPDVVVYDEKRQWLFLIEAVTSHGPISPKRLFELEQAFKDSKVGLVFVTAFPNQAEFRKNASDIAWDTEVWIADNPDHMIHFNGDRFLGPHQ